ncbi:MULTISPECIES: DNA starvation/stationary phase protection protein [unclassified Mycoplasma]|uniref:ferritin-like domain-containing protein n=1 Tax=unclassified Mycoplasma TaxID=2683645 RepID=UPI0013749DD7
MNKLLASVAVATQNAQNMHWNVRGQQFRTFHKLTEKLYQGLNEFVDALAEKIAMQNDQPLSTMASYLEHSQIKEYKPHAFSAQEIVTNVVNDLNKIQTLAEQVKTNSVIQPLLDEIFLFVDKQRWFFAAHAK